MQLLLPNGLKVDREGPALLSFWAAEARTMQEGATGDERCNPEVVRLERAVLDLMIKAIRMNHMMSS